MGFFGAYVYDGASWIAFDADAGPSDSQTAEPWLSVVVHDSDFATVRYAPSGGGLGAAHLGFTPRSYFEDPDASLPTDVERESIGLASWVVAIQGRTDAAELPKLIAPYLAADAEPDNSGYELDDADIFVEVKVARLLRALGLPVPDDLPETE